MKSYEREQKQGFTKLNNALIKAGFKKEILNNGMIEYKRFYLNDEGDIKILQSLKVIKGMMLDVEFINEIWFNAETGKKIWDTLRTTESAINTKVSKKNLLNNEL